MYTTEQTQALKEFREILRQYNQGEIEYQTYVELTLPLWDKINLLFGLDQKSS